jgi:hypothetical protein
LRIAKDAVSWKASIGRAGEGVQHSIRLGMSWLYGTK